MIGSTPTDLPAIIDPSWRFGIIASAFHKEHADALADGAARTLHDAGIPDANIRIVTAPGSFEIPLLGKALAEAGSVDALMGFGIIVEGETHHAALLASSVAQGIMDVSITHTIPFAFEVLYVDDLQQAVARTKGEHNKGAEAARAVLWALSELKRIGR
jgi:6,7-dimethyl-8-ribityllumazine synthase